MAQMSEGVDRLAEATGGKHHWNDPGMDDFEAGWEEFPLGTRVEVRTIGDVWRRGTVVETLNENDRAIVVECDEQWHDNREFYGGRGVTVMAYMNTRRGILSNLRAIGEPLREVIIPRREPCKLEGMKAELLRLAELAVLHSGGRLRLAFNEENESKEFAGGAARFLKLDGKRLGRDIELYGFMSEVVGWEVVLVNFLNEVLVPIKKKLPESYAKAGDDLRVLGESVYPERTHTEWQGFF